MSVPAITTVDDEARTRAGDPLSSHVAGDRSAKNLKLVADAVVWIIHHYGPCTGDQINTHYRERQVGMGWPVAKWDSPRKRAGELAKPKSGRLVADIDGVRGHPTVYRLPVELVEPPVGEVLT